MSEQKSAPSQPENNETRRGRFSGWVQRKFMPVEEVGRSAELTVNMFSSILGDERNARNEKFDEAVKRQKLTDQDLLGAYKRQRLIALIVVGVIALTLLYLVNLLISAQVFADYFVAVMALGPLLLLATVALRASFRAWQIRHRRLGGFKEFMANKSNWWPVALKEIPKRKPAKRPKANAPVSGKTKPKQISAT